MAIGVGIAIVFVILASLYNTLVGLKNRVENVLASVDVLLKKRYDLIPELVSTVKTYMQYEQKTLTNIAAIRSRAVSSNVTQEGRVELENRLSEELGNLLVAVEAYPDLKANQNFLELQKSLNEIEEQLSAARRFYNTSVTNYNNAIEMFPTNLVAAIMNYHRKKLFETPVSEQQKVNVGNLFNQ
ncbi:LemA family protein [Zarconia navalis]|uniref:LemA family protein n=1 Tax=Zarconia navalis TaxID=2992134 RepID=UPI0021F89A0C|nr:LemA family protein [Zarconia navalis]